MPPKTRKPTGNSRSKPRSPRTKKAPKEFEVKSSFHAPGGTRFNFSTAEQKNDRGELEQTPIAHPYYNNMKSNPDEPSAPEPFDPLYDSSGLRYSDRVPHPPIDPSAPSPTLDEAVERRRAELATVPRPGFFSGLLKAIDVDNSYNSESCNEDCDSDCDIHDGEWTPTEEPDPETFFGSVKEPFVFWNKERAKNCNEHLRDQCWEICQEAAEMGVLKERRCIEMEIMDPPHSSESDKEFHISVRCRTKKMKEKGVHYAGHIRALKFQIVKLEPELRLAAPAEAPVPASEIPIAKVASLSIDDDVSEGKTEEVKRKEVTYTQWDSLLYDSDPKTFAMVWEDVVKSDSDGKVVKNWKP
ncbi:hypothetical protein BJ508DRAFT_417166 [Ascobolus immersus RN42]|uniref:Uncharacterized protein n=1 Tax=Ascobolus immersus RN42 TaxID=1160509 RepID=A0A3N4HZF5_ASCIM|nr:hypothetical protein BJ508DRAFT_417166 [Ascobolus immersus RN42]